MKPTDEEIERGKNAANKITKSLCGVKEEITKDQKLIDLLPCIDGKLRFLNGILCTRKEDFDNK